MIEDFIEGVEAICAIIGLIIEMVKEANPTVTDEQILYVLLREYKQ